MIKTLVANLRRIEFGSIAMIRVSNMVIGFVLTMITTWYVTRTSGEAGFALYVILVSILSSMPFADLGLGAGVVNATTDFVSGRIGRGDYWYTIRRTAAILIGVSVVLVLLAVFAGTFGLWPRMLGSSAGSGQAGLAATGVGIALAVSVPLGIGSRVLQGTSRTRLWAWLMFVGSAVQGVVLAMMMAIGAPAEAFVLGPSLSLVSSSLVTTIVAFRVVGFKGSDFYRVPNENHSDRVRVSREYKVVQSALPYLITLVGVTLTLQLQRILLSHVSSTHEVAVYGFLSQFVVSANSVVTLGSLNLWSSYRDLRESGNGVLGRFQQDTRAFFAVGLVVAAGVCGVAALSAEYLTSGSIELTWQTYVASSALMLVWACARPGIMFLNYPRGFWFQAVWAVPCAVVSVALTLVFGAADGAAGAFAASSIAIFAFTLVPNALMARLEVRRLAQSGSFS